MILYGPEHENTHSIAIKYTSVLLQLDFLEKCPELTDYLVKFVQDREGTFKAPPMAEDESLETFATISPDEAKSLSYYLSFKWRGVYLRRILQDDRALSDLRIAYVGLAYHLSDTAEELFEVSMQLGHIYRSRGEYNRAREYFLRPYERCRDLYGRKDPRTISKWDMISSFDEEARFKGLIFPKPL
jgi:hypothetical protein